MMTASELPVHTHTLTDKYTNRLITVWGSELIALLTEKADTQCGWRKWRRNIAGDRLETSVPSCRHTLCLVHSTWTELDWTELQFRSHTITCTTAMDVAKPGLTSVPSSSGNGIWFCGWITTTTPAVSPASVTYSSCWIFIVSARPVRHK